MNLLESPKVKKDLNAYKNAVNKIDDSKNKQHFQDILNEYISRVKIINDTHSSKTPGLIKPSSIQEHIKELGDLRTQLDNLVKSVN